MIQIFYIIKKKIILTRVMAYYKRVIHGFKLIFYFILRVSYVVCENYTISINKNEKNGKIKSIGNKQKKIYDFKLFYLIN